MVLGDLRSLIFRGVNWFFGLVKERGLRES